MDKISLFHGQKFAISEFSRHMEYDFLKEDHKNNFHTKNQEVSQLCLEVIGQKLSKLSILPKILVLNCQNFAISEFSRHIEYDFLKEDHKNNFHTKKLGRFIAAFWKLQVKNSQNCQFWSKNGLKWTKYRHIRILSAYRV